jgi:tryptophan synthase beta chain
MACNFFGMDLEVYMVKVSYQQKPYRRIVMRSYGAEVYASPTDRTNYGRSLLAETPDSPGSLGIAISEAVEVAAMSGGAKKYSLGSVLNHVLLHQTVIGQEALMQMEMAGEYPDIVIGCTGGGSNFAGFAFPFLQQNLTNGKKTHVIAVEPYACPTPDAGRIHLRFWRHGHDGSHRQDAHPGPYLHAARHPRRRLAVSWDGAAGERAGQ